VRSRLDSATPAGYSLRSLPEKLGIKAGQRIALLGAPDGYDETLGALPADVEVTRTLRGSFAFLQQFCTRRTELEDRLPKLKKALQEDGALWISWPKKASGVACDFTEDYVRAMALAIGLVDVKVCAVDAIWSGLKLVVPLADRQARKALKAPKARRAPKAPKARKAPR
jgi:hypothetical protein